MVQGLRGGIPLSRGEFAVFFRTRSHRWPLFLFLVPLSFGMRSPSGSGVLVSSHLIANDGCCWSLALHPSGWASSLCLRLLFAPCHWRRVSWWSSLWPRVFESPRLSPVFFPIRSYGFLNTYIALDHERRLSLVLSPRSFQMGFEPLSEASLRAL